MLTKAELQQKRAGLIKEQKALIEKALGEGRAMSAEEQGQVKAKQTEIDNLGETVKALDTATAQAAELEEPETKLFRPATVAPGTQPEKLDDCGFKNVGEFLYAVKNGDPKGRMKDLATGDVGIAIPPQFSANILQLDGEAEIVMPRATNVPAGDPPDAPLSIPYLQQGADGELGGIELTWTAEGAIIPDIDDPVIKDLTLTPQEVSGLATVNNKTLANWAAAGVLIQKLMRMAWVNGRDKKFLSGSGVGCPLGIYKSPGRITIERGTTATIIYLDTLNLFARLYAGAGAAVYVANQTLIPTLMMLADTAGRMIFNGGDATKGIPPTLNGIPILWNGKTPLLGSEGDLALMKPDYYLTKMGSGPFVAVSDQFKFDKNKTCFRIVANIDGQLWVKDPLLLQDGATTVSPVVILK